MSWLGEIFSGLGDLGLDFWSEQRQNKQNEHMQRVANNFTIDMWNKNNEYNTPTAQMERLRDAGLNPQLALGNSGVMNTTSSSPQGAVGSSATHVDSFDMGKILKDVADSRLASKQAKQSEAQTDVLDTVAHNNREQAKLLQAQTEGANLDNSMKEIRNAIETFKLNTGIFGDDWLSNVARSVGGAGRSLKKFINNTIDNNFLFYQAYDYAKQKGLSPYEFSVLWDNSRKDGYNMSGWRSYVDQFSREKRKSKK